MRRAVFLLTASLALASCSEEAAEKTSPAPEGSEGASHEETAGRPISGFGDGVNTRAVTGTVDEAVARLEAALEEQGFSIVAKLDHQANAEKVGLELRPATVLIFGKPEVGTSLIQAAPTAALDLPQRMAIYDDGEGVVVAYNDPRFLSSRHLITEQDEKLEQIAQALSGLASIAAGAEPADDLNKDEDN